MPFSTIAAIFYLFVFPFLVAAKIIEPTWGAIAFGTFLYLQLLAITLEITFDTFAELYNFKKISLLSFLPELRIRRIIKPPSKKSPVLSIIFSYAFIIYIFSIAYFFIDNYSEKSFNKDNIDFIDATFLSFTSISVGPSGIEPNSTLTKSLVMVEVLIGIIYSVLVFSLVASLIKGESNKQST